MSDYEAQFKELFTNGGASEFTDQLRNQVAEDEDSYLLDIGTGVLSGAVDAVDETLNFGRSLVGLQRKRILTEVDRPVTAVGDVTDDLTQFLVGLAGAGKVTKVIGGMKTGFQRVDKGIDLVKRAGGKDKNVSVMGKDIEVGKVTKGFVDSALSSTIAHNPYEERLADVVARYPSIAQPLGEALRGDIDDTEFERRAKMALEDVVVNGAVTAGLAATFKGLLKVWRLRNKGQIDEAAEAELKAAGEKLEEASAGAKEEAVETAKRTAKKGNKSATKEATEDVSEVATPAKAEVQETPTAATKSDTPKKDSPEAVDAELPPTPKMTKKKAQEVVKALRTAEGDEKSFEELQEGVDSFMYNILQTRRANGQAEHISLYEDMDVFYSSVGRQVMDLTADAQQTVKRTETFDELSERAAAQLAETAGLTTDEVATHLAKHASNTREAYTFLAATDAMIRKQYDDLYDLANVADEAFDDTVRMSLLVEFEKLERLIQGATGIRTEMGRALKSRQMGIKSYDEFTGGLLNVSKATARKTMEDPDALRLAIRNAKDPAEIAKLARLSSNKRIAGPLGEFFRSMILFNYKTQVTNALSGVVETFLMPAERYMGSLLADGLYREAGGAAIRADAKAQLVGLKQVANDSLAYAATALKEERNILDPLRTTTENTQHRISAKYLGVSEDSTTGRFVDFIGKSSRLSLRVLGSSDEFLKQINYRSFIKAKATREGLETGVEDLDGFVAKRMDEAFDSAGRGIDQEALEYSQRSTFTEDLGNNFFGDLQRLAVKYPAMQLILPFIRTPTNLLKRAGQRTPLLANLSKSVRDDIAAGGVRRAEALGRQAMGAMVMTSMFFAFGEGKLTGAGPTDPKARRFLRNAGWQPYSVKIGGQYYSYNRLDPNFIMIGAVATAYEAMSPVLAEEDATLLGEADEMMSALFLGITQTFKNKAYFQGVSNFLTLMSAEDEKSLSRIGNTASNFAASFIPAALTQTTDLVQGNEALVEAIGLADKLKKKIPIIKDSLPKKYNWVTGQTIDYPVISNTLGFQSQTVHDTPVMRELRAIGYGFSGPEKRLSKRDLTSEQFSDYSRLTGQIKLGGKTLNQSLAEIFASSTWKNTPDEMKRYRPDGPMTLPISAVSREIGRYKRAAREELMKKYPELKDAITKYKRIRQGLELTASNR